MTKYNELINNLEYLKLDAMRGSLSSYLDLIKDGKKSVIDALYEMSEKEKDMRKKERSVLVSIRRAFHLSKQSMISTLVFNPASVKKRSWTTVRFVSSKKKRTSYLSDHLEPVRPI